MLFGLLLVLQTPSEPMRTVEIDGPAFGMAFEMAACLKNSHKELRSVKSFADREKHRAELCEIERRNVEILDRLKLVTPNASEPELLETHKNIVLMAMFYRTSETKIEDNSSERND